MSIKKVLFLALGTLLPFSLLLAQSSATAGALSGSVTTSDGATLAGAEVRYMSVAPSVAAGLRQTPAPGETFVTGTVLTDTNGNFAVAGLTPAAYLLCATVPSAPYLDPCIWQQAIEVTVSAGATAYQTLALQQGVYLSVRVNDPMQLLPQVIDGPWTTRKLQVGVVYGAGAYQGVPNTAVDSAGHSYQLIVPAGVSFNVWLYSTDVTLTNASGAAVAIPDAGTAFQASVGQDPTFTFTVSGPQAVPNERHKSQ